jgi:hypothetical protein
MRTHIFGGDLLTVEIREHSMFHMISQYTGRETWDIVLDVDIGRQHKVVNKWGRHNDVPLCFHCEESNISITSALIPQIKLAKDGTADQFYVIGHDSKHTRCKIAFINPSINQVDKFIARLKIAVNNFNNKGGFK